MTRAEIEAEYQVTAGVITSPGKFEGEAVYVPAFWAQSLDGGGDDDRGRHQGFQITERDRAEWPELPSTDWLWLSETDDGFVVELSGEPDADEEGDDLEPEDE